MVSLLFVEANLLVAPAFVLFILFIIPVKGLSRLMARVMATIERPNLYGVSLLVLLTLLTAAAFLNAMMEWRNVFSHGKPRFPNAKAESTWERGKWRKERDMYLHGLCSVLFASLMKFSRLHVALESAREAKAAPVVAEKKSA